MEHDPSLFALPPEDTLSQLKDYYFPPYITLAHLFNAPLGWSIPPRSLTQYQLQYVFSGMANYHVGGQDHLTKRGDLILHRPNERHSVKMVENEPYVCISIVFHFGDRYFPFDELIEKKHYLGNFTDHPVEKKLSQLITRYHQPGLSTQMLCQSLLLELFYELSKAGEINSPKNEVIEKTRTKLILIRNYIAESYNKKIKQSDLEEISGLSRNYITVKFKKAFGMTPFEYLLWIRIEKAKELAVQSKLSISEIANQVGYSDVHTFGKMFKKKTGTSLSQFCASLVIH